MCWIPRMRENISELLSLHLTVENCQVFLKVDDHLNFFISIVDTSNFRESNISKIIVDYWQCLLDQFISTSSNIPPSWLNCISSTKLLNVVHICSQNDLSRAKLSNSSRSFFFNHSTLTKRVTSINSFFRARFPSMKLLLWFYSFQLKLIRIHTANILPIIPPS